MWRRCFTVSRKGWELNPLSCEIPIPISTNDLWRIAGRRIVASNAYKKWLKHAVPILRFRMDKAKRFPVTILIEVRGGEMFPAFRDLDNILKATVDALKYSERIPEDTVKYVSRIEMQYHPPVEGLPANCVVTITERNDRD